MTVTIEQITDFRAIEDAIATWAKTASALPNYATSTLPSDKKHLSGGRAIYWEGSEFDRVRPYILLTKISQPTQGQPWFRKNYNSVTDNYETTYFQPFKWSVQISCFVDSYDQNHKKIRVSADSYIQNIINRSYIQSVNNILEAADIAFHPLGQTIRPNVLSSVDDDKYINQATIEYLFSGIVQTVEKDTDYFTSITPPTEDNGGLILAEI